MVGSVAGDLPEQVKNNQSVNMAAGNGGQKMSQYSWFTVYFTLTRKMKKSGNRNLSSDKPRLPEIPCFLHFFAILFFDF